MAPLAGKAKIKISTAGRLSKYNNIAGFTLVELIVVVSIISTLLLFSFPVFRDIVLFHDSSNQVGRIVRLINDLKKRAVNHNIDYLLNFDPGVGVVWVTHDNMDDMEKEAAKENGVVLSDDIEIIDVEYPGQKKTGIFLQQVRFRKQGYSDFALVHIVESGNAITLKIEPFLSQVQLLNSHVYLEDCI